MNAHIGSAIDPPRLLTFWQGPLVPVALTMTFGILLDRWITLPPILSLVGLGIGLAFWLIERRSGKIPAPFFLWAAAAFGGAFYHHWWREEIAANDISHFAALEPRLARVRGVVESEPILVKGPEAGPLRSFPTSDSLRLVMRAQHLEVKSDWRPVSGWVQVNSEGHSPGIHAGDEIEVIGFFALPQDPGNPGEFDYADYLRDRKIRSVLSVKQSADSLVRYSSGRPVSLWSLLGLLRERANAVLAAYLPESQLGLARALLLGDSSGLDQENWDQYLRTGTIHVLAISGQHLAVLGAFLWLVLRIVGLRQRSIALVVALTVLGYALLTGGRPPALRAAWMVVALCGSYWVLRPPHPANSFALAWLLIALANPTDLIQAGCMLSFIAVAVLIWGTRDWFLADPVSNILRHFHLLPLSVRDDPLETLIEESRPFWLRSLRRLGHWLVVAFLVNAALWFTVTPLVAARYHLISPVALLIGPPAVVLSSVALVAGFLLLIVGPVFGMLALPLAWVTASSLWACSTLVNWGKNVPLGWWYVGQLPIWWLGGFYFLLLAGLWLERVRPRWKGWLGIMALWCLVLLILGCLPKVPGGFRCTFLAVGHGNCTVLELPDGRTLLYDAGALTGPEVTRRHIAPFLWHRRIRRLDEVFLSHADLDHFNGLVDLLDRFPVGRVTCTPSFQERALPAVAVTLESLAKRGLPLRIVKQGEILGDKEVSLEVLHPPQEGPVGNENSRSLVLLIRHQGLALLLTGDLEGPGLEMLLARPPTPVDVLMAPHHGSLTANSPRLAAWAQPQFVISSQGPSRSNFGADPYAPVGGRFLTTWHHGAVTLRTHLSGWEVQTFRTAQQWVCLPRNDWRAPKVTGN